MTTTDRITQLEREIISINQDLAMLKEFVSANQFIPPSKASKILGISSATIIDRIRQAKAFPKESPYKKGIHWNEEIFPSRTPGKDPTVRYRVNPVEWRKVS